MSEDTDNIVLKYLRAIRADQEQIMSDMAVLKVRVTNLEENQVVANQRLDRIEARLHRIEKRLDLVEA